MRFRQSIDRRQLGRIILSVAAGALGSAAQAVNDPWSDGELMQPEELANALKGGGSTPAILCVTFPVLYRQRHIARAIYAGPGGKPAGISALHAELAKLDKTSTVVLYCGCCPMTKCPNIRPAYRAAKDSKFTKVRVLNLTTNLHTDWVAKGFPVAT